MNRHSNLWDPEEPEIRHDESAMTTSKQTAENMAHVSAPRRSLMTVRFAHGRDLASAIEVAGGRSRAVLPSLAERRPGDAVVVGASFADGTSPITFTGAVIECRRAKLARTSYLVVVEVAEATADALRRVAVRGPEPSNRRHKRRRETSILVIVEMGATRAAGRIVDLSPEGARVIADLEWPPVPGTAVALEFLDPTLRFMTRAFRATVRWSDASHGGRGFGVQFEQMDPLTRGVIARAVEETLAPRSVHVA